MRAAHWPVHMNSATLTAMESTALGLAGMLLVLLAGWLGGACGIGGVLMVPALAAIEHVAPHKSIAASSVAFAVMGALAFLSFRHERRVVFGHGVLMLSVAPGAAVGALLVHSIPAHQLMAGLGLLLITSGMHGFIRPRQQEAPAPAPLVIGCIGIVVGLGSALTGTGGAVLLIPILLAMRQPLQPTIAASIAIQLPIGGSGVVGHLVAGSIDVILAAQLSFFLVAGAIAGRWCADRVPVQLLRHAVTLLLIAVGAWILVRLPN
jgi:uncharacterized membrane protein YfcA